MIALFLTEPRLDWSPQYRKREHTIIFGGQFFITLLKAQMSQFYQHFLITQKTRGFDAAIHVTEDVKADIEKLRTLWRLLKGNFQAVQAQ